MAISLIDGFAGIIPLSLILTYIMGINGMWLAFPLLSLIMLLGITAVNLLIAGRSGGRYQGILLFENDERDIPTYDVTINLCAEDVARSARMLQEFCLEKMLSGYIVLIELWFDIWCLRRKRAGGKICIYTKIILIRTKGSFPMLHAKKKGRSISGFWI